MEKNELVDLVDIVFVHYIECDLDDAHREEVEKGYAIIKQMIEERDESIKRER